MRISKEDRDKRRKKFGDSRKNRGESYGAPTKTRVYNEYTGQYVTVTKDPGFGTSIEDKERVAGEAPSVGDTIDKRAPQGLITGTAIGASIGTKIAPGVGTAIGAGIGAAVGTAIGIAVGFKEGKEAVESYEETAQLGLELEAEQKQAEQDEEERMLKQQLQDEIRMQGQQNQMAMGQATDTQPASPMQNPYSSAYSSGGIQSVDDSNMLSYEPGYARRKKQIFG